MILIAIAPAKGLLVLVMSAARPVLVRRQAVRPTSLYPATTMLVDIVANSLPVLYHNASCGQVDRPRRQTPRFDRLTLQELR
ncbi:MAG: hypothetical protein R3B90_23455 [Planctomycetaceae bacterium]